jgi:hypothetical protein
VTDISEELTVSIVRGGEFILNFGQYLPGYTVQQAYRTAVCILATVRTDFIKVRGCL